jgi:hypothetical protein
MHALATKAIASRRDLLIILLSNLKKLAALRALPVITLTYFLKESLKFK